MNEYYLITALTNVNIGLSIFNLLVVFLSFKMYTEYVKDKLQDKRKKNDN
jgi:hypothetical protein